MLPTAAGEARPLEPYGISRYHGAWWFPNGRQILFTGSEAGRLRSFVQDVSGTPPRPLTDAGMWGLAISPDGEWVAATGEGQRISLWPTAGGPTRFVPGSKVDDRPVAWTPDGHWLWVFRRDEVPAPVLLLNISTGERRPWKKLVPPDPNGVYVITDFVVTPSGNAYFYNYSRLLSHLYVARNLQ